MNPIRSVTVCVANIDEAIARYTTWLDYGLVEEGCVSAALASSWDAAATTGARQVVLRPASGMAVDLRFIEAPPMTGFEALRTYGWAALELCIEDVHATHARLAAGPFDIIGPPSAVAGLPTIHPMQVLGPDNEVVYLTQILESGPATGLPTVHAPIDRTFIVVLACADLERNARWCVEQLGVRIVDDLSIPYRMLNRSFDLPAGTQHRLITCSREDDIFIELDQYPPQATPRQARADHLPPGIALCTLLHPDLEAIAGPWTTQPVPRDGAIYEGRRVGVLRSPEGALFEVVEG